MRSARARPGLLIAVELGAEWPECFVKQPALCVRRVVAQVEGETPEAFAGRLSTLTGRLFPRGAMLADAVVACNERTDAAALAARRALGRVLLERMGPTGTLTLAGSARAGGRLRHALSALALDLAPGAYTNVTVRFEDEGERPSEPAVARVA